MSNIFNAEAAARATRWEQPVLRGHLDSAPHTAKHLDELETAAYEDGYARGHADGQAQGYADGVRIVREQAERLRALLDHFGRPLREIDNEVERMVIALALEVGRRLAQQALQQDPSLVAAIVHEAIGALTQPVRDARVHLHPADVELLNEVLTMPAEVSGWRLIADPDLIRGDCRVITDTAQVDARLDTREASLAQSLLGDRA